MVETFDRLRRGDNSPRSAWLVLASAMLVSVLLALRFGRNAWFSIDELTWLSSSRGLDLSGALEPHVGHLILVPRLVYKLALATIGAEYLTFRLLTMGAILLTAALFLVWARRRVPDFVALAGCLVILLFPSDAWHLLGGNGFTVLFALACGLAALIAWDRGDLRGDVATFVLLILGIATYTVAIPFAIGLIVAALLERSGKRRLWVGLAPIALYMLWRVLAGVSGSEPSTGGSDWTNLILLPAWTFESLGAILGAWSGLNFDFTKGTVLPPRAGAGPALALVALAALGWRISRGQTGSLLWVAISIALALFAAQTLAWGTAARGPGEARYLYPGLIVVFLVAVEAARGLKWSRTPFVVLWVVTGVSMLTARGLLKENTAWFELWGEQARAEITAVALLDSTGRAPTAENQPRQRLHPEFESDRGATYGFLGYDPPSLRSRPAGIGNWVDSFLSKSLSLNLAPVPRLALLGRCRAARPRGERFGLALPQDGAVLRSPVATEISLGRFGEGRSIELGTVGPGSSRLLELYPDSDPTPWFVTSDEPGLIGCGVIEPAR